LTLGDLLTLPPEDHESEPSLRERKKLRTRASIVAAAQRLFAEKGYAATTLEDICDEAEVALPTLFRYFETKAHLALAPHTGWVTKLRAELEDRQRSTPTIDVWRRHMAVLSQPDIARANKTRLAWIEPEPTLRSLLADVDIQLENILTSALAMDAGSNPDEDVHARLVATALVRGRAAVFRRWLLRREPVARLAAEQAALIDFVTTELPRSQAIALNQGLAECHKTQPDKEFDLRRTDRGGAANKNAD
jgi:AcrR family transcriptional regulator